MDRKLLFIEKTRLEECLGNLYHIASKLLSIKLSERLYFDIQ